MIAEVTPVENIFKGEEWMRTGDEMTSYRKTIITLGRVCRECGNERADLEINQLIADNSSDDDVVIHTDGSVQRGLRSGWGFLFNFERSQYC